MNVQQPTIDHAAAAYIVALNDSTINPDRYAQLYEAALVVISSWASGNLAEAVRELDRAVKEIDEHNASIEAHEAGWDRQGEVWVRLRTEGEGIDPGLKPSAVWISDGLIRAHRAEDALTQDFYRDRVKH